MKVITTTELPFVSRKVELIFETQDEIDSLYHRLNINLQDTEHETMILNDEDLNTELFKVLSRWVSVR